MKKIFIKDLKVNDDIFSESFAIKRYKKSVTRSNKPYIDIELADNTGKMSAKIWSDDLKNCKETKEGDVVVIDGKVEDFQGKLQFKISKLDLLKDFKEEDYIQKSKLDQDKMFTEMMKDISSIKDTFLRSLLEIIFEDKNFALEFQKAAAGYVVHHSYSGGLLEHTLEVLNISKAAIEKFPKINRDITLTGCILHDIGKVFEYRIGSTVNITKEGKLLGHIFLGADFIKEKTKEIKGFPDDLLDEIIHIILSHHGEIEYGSPIKPKTLEAMTIWLSDYMSTNLNMGYSLLHEGNITDDFTEYHRHLKTELYKSPYLEPDKEALF